MLLTVMYPVYLLVSYSVIRPMLQPFAFLQVKIFGLPISFPFVVIITVAGFMYMFLKPSWRIIAEKSGFLTSFVIIALLTSAFSMDYMVSLTGLLKLLTAWFIFNIAYNSIKNIKDINILLAGLVASSTIPVLVGFYQSFTGHYDFLLDATVDRVSSVFGVGNAYGIFLSIITAAIVILLLGETNKKRRIILLAFLIGVLVSQVLALNRGTWLALAAGFAVAAYKYRHYISYKWLAVLMVFILIFFSKIIIDRFDDIDTRVRWSGKNTLEGRIDYWNNLLPLIAEKPLTGYGVGTTGIVAQKYLNTSEVPHNDFIRLALETGLLGSIFYFLFLIRISIYFYLRPADRELWKYNFALLMLSVYFLIISMVQNVIYNQINFPAFLILVAVGIKINGMYKKTDNIEDVAAKQCNNDATIINKQRILKYKRNE